MSTYYAPAVLCPDGWRQRQQINLDAHGYITQITAANGRACDYRLSGPVIPGMNNLHSHAFQRSLVGLTGLKSSADDSFWSWRQAMYQQVAQMDPDRIEAVTAYCYMEQLRGGYTSVAEFHYLHHPQNLRYCRATDGYLNPAETSLRVMAAAQQAGIGLTLLPVLYSWAGFGEQALARHQQAFAHTLDSYCNLLELVANQCQSHSLCDWGVAPHSLRAVSEAQLQGLLEYLQARDFNGPIHIHIAEQIQEVADCEAFYGSTPVNWLLDNFPVDKRWCLVHATHVTAAELEKMAVTAAVVGLCPTTEADLGDGIFPAARWQQLGGAWGIGSDSNLCVSVAEELRLLEYGQRLRDTGRNVLAETGQSIGTQLYLNALAGGQQAMGNNVSRGLAVGQRADFLVLNQNHPLMLAKSDQQLLDTFVFAGQAEMLAQVWVAGRCLVDGGRHISQEQIEKQWRASI